MSITEYIVNLLNDKKEQIEFNIGIVATILAGGNTDLLDPFDIAISLPNDVIMKVDVKSVNGNMTIGISSKDIEYLFTNGMYVTAKIDTPNLDAILEKLASNIMHNLSHTMRYEIKLLADEE